MRHLLPSILAAVSLAFACVLGFEALASLVAGQILLLVVALAVLMVTGVMLRPERSLPLLCDPFLLCCLFLAQFYLIGPVIMGIWGLSEIAFFRAPGIEAAKGPLLGALLMVGMAIVGYRSELGRIVARTLPEFGPRPRKLPRSWVITAVVGAGIFGCLWWLQYQGGLFAKLGLGYGTGRYGAAFTLAFNFFILGTILWAWHLLDSPTRTRGQVLAFYAVLVFEAVFFGIIYGVRKYLFFLFFGLIVCAALRRGVRSLPKVRLAAILAGLLVFFTVWGAVRATPLAALMGFGQSTPQVRERELREGYFSGVADPFGSATLIWQIFPEQEPFRHGSTLLVTVLGFIPRAVWPDKPVGIGKDITRYYVGPFYEPVEGYSVTVTLPADFYANFGWPGVAIGGLLLGVVFRVVAAYAVMGMRNGLQTRAARVLLPTLFVTGLGEVRADMSTLLAFYIMTGLPLVAALLVFRMDGPEAESVRSTAPVPRVGALDAPQGSI